MRRWDETMDCPACHSPNVDSARFCAKCGALLPMPSTDDQDSLVGQIVGGRYRITQLLGEGGMGRVYLAEQQMGTSVRKVAVKTLQSQYTSDPQVLARFHRECGTVSELEHPNTIQFFDFGQTPDGQLYIAMEYVQGQSLSSALEHGPMAPDRLLHILAQVCGSLEEAHNRGIIHRDLKPDNIILSTRAGQQDFVKVLDFGIAKRSEAKDQAQEQKLTQQGMVLGTPPYMSPEQFTGRELDARSDIYSLGVMAYEMLTGRLPFHAETAWEWATKHMTEQPFPFESTPSGALIPAPMRAGVLRALAKDREQRQATVRRFYDDLAGALPPGSVAVDSSSRGGTAAMAAPPDFASLGMGGTSGPGGTAAIPVAYTPPAQAAVPPMSQPQVPAPSRASGSKGLILGLAGLAGVLAIAGIVLFARSAKKGGEGSTPNLIASPTATAPAATTTATAAEPTPDPSPLASANVIQPPANPPAARPPQEAAQKPALKGEAACTEAKRLADNRDIRGAVSNFKNCEGPSQAAARASIARNVPAAVRDRVFNGDCAGAKAILAAATGVGSGAPAADALIASNCKK